MIAVLFFWNWWKHLICKIEPISAKSDAFKNAGVWNKWIDK